MKITNVITHMIVALVAGVVIMVLSHVIPGGLVGLLFGQPASIEQTEQEAKTAGQKGRTGEER